MNERSLVLMGGAPGSGTTRLGRSIEQQLLHERSSARHISVGDRIRGIGNGTIRSVCTAIIVDHLNSSDAHRPLDDEVMYSITSEALSQYDDWQIVLLDGYPRYEPQVGQVEELAVKDARTIRGMLATSVDTETSLARMIKRSQSNPDRAFTLDEAITRLADHSLTFPPLIDALCTRDIPVRRIDSTGSKGVTDQLGLRAVRDFLQQGDSTTE